MLASPSKLAHLLIVDDDHPTRMLLRGVLGRQGYQITEAANGLQALQRIAEQRPDLVLLDVMMPELDGYGTCARIRELDADDNLPIIMLTGAEDIAAIDLAFNAGATDFITKPINWPLLTQRVRYALRTGALNRQVRENRMREASVRRIAGLGFWGWDLSSGALQWSDELQTLTGVAPAAVASVASLVTRLHPDDRPRLLHAFEMAQAVGARIELELRLQSTSATIQPAERVVHLIGERGQQGQEAERVYGAFQDVTASRQTAALVDFLALHDELTGLGNRRLFLQQVNRALQQAQGSATPSTALVGCIDLVRFKRFNDSMGTSSADKLLTLLAQRLRVYATGGNEVARIGGDEFAVLLLVQSEAEAEERFEHLVDALGLPFKVDGHEVFITCSAGVALHPQHGGNAEQLLQQAQEAQRLARSQGRTWLTASLDAEDASRMRAALELERALRRALEAKQFFLVYQPQMDLTTGKIVGVEALLRWQHPVHGVVPPVRFIPLLEDLGLINAVGEWVLREACLQAARWVAQGLGLRVGVNLSPRQFLDPHLFDIVLDAAQQAQVAPALIELEITESLAIQDLDHSIQLLRRFRDAGFKVAVDDFGIGYSSLEYLLRFPLDVIKIDRAFITDITATQADRAIVRAVTVMGQSLGLQVIAEGVETQRQCDFLEALGVSEVQGYLIGKPMLADELERLVASFTRPH